MKNRAILRIILAVLLIPVAAASADLPDQSTLRKHVEILTSLPFQGRGAGSIGEKLAADYIVAAFKEIGLQPAVLERFLQKVPIPDADGKYRSESLACNNVIGAIDLYGGGKAILIGAHYDHLGIVDGKMYPGADDNASGVAALLEIARAFKKQNPHDGPVIFIAFGAEEIGRIGSKQYMRNPSIPPHRIKAMVNIDMVGRLGEKDILYAMEGISEKDCESFAATAGDGFSITRMRSGYEAGDMASFVEKKIPSLFLFTGPHADYHRPTDTPDKIDYAGLARVTSFAIQAIPRFAELAAAGFTGEPAMHPMPQSAGEPRSFCGTVPDFSATQGNGVLVGDVIPGSPAEKAGILPGDTITRLGERKIDGLRAYAEALREKKPGDVVAITVTRGEETLIFPVTLEEKREGSGGHPGHINK